MAGGLTDEDIFVQYLDKARPYQRMMQTLRAVRAICFTAWFFLPLFFMMPSVLYWALLAGFVFLVLFLDNFGRWASGKVENQSYYLLRAINQLGATSTYVAWGLYHFELGPYLMRADLWRYATKGGAEGLTCVQFPRLRGSMSEICVELYAYGQQAGRYLRSAGPFDTTATDG